jgi:phenylalanine-4-hydroxylase
MRSHYRIDDFQEVYFVLDSLDQLLEFAKTDFEPLYQANRGQAELEPGDIFPTDVFIHRGTKQYHMAAGRNSG